MFRITSNGFLWRIESSKALCQRFNASSIIWSAISDTPSYELFTCYHDNLESAKNELEKINKYKDSCWIFVPIEEEAEPKPTKTIDMLGTKCNKCKKGYYNETLIYDNWEGKAHCNLCGDEVVRYKYK